MAEDSSKAQRASDFQQACRNVGMDLAPPEAIAAILGISISYVDQLWRGSNAISAPIRKKFEEIAAKANGPGELLEQFEVDLPAHPKVLPVIDTPVGKLARTGYLVDPNNETGEYRIIRIVANCPDYHTACELCDLLNKEAG